MTKLKTPLLSLGARGRLGRALSFVRRRGQNIVEKMPQPEDAKSLAQLSWRHMYQKAVALWNALNASEKLDWESLARPHHMTGFAWFMSQCLKPNPGIYLPLQGGTMSGDIDMAKNKILKLPTPTDDQEAANKAYVDAAAPEMDYPKTLKPALTRYVIPGYCIAVLTNNAFLANEIYYIPIFVGQQTTYDRICVNVQTAAVGTADLRIFDWNSGLPKGLILSAGIVDTSTTGAKEIIISQKLTRGYYFLAVRCTGSPRFNVPHRAYTPLVPVSGFTTASNADPRFIVLSVTAAYADPAPAPTTGHWVEMVAVYLREA